MQESMGHIKREKMGRKPCCEKQGVNTGTWSAGEDKILKNYIQVHREGKWRDLPKRAGLNRCGKSCRLRWLNYLRPDIKRGNISADEEELIIRLHKLLGNRWSLIAGRLPGRTDNEIKNYWNTNLSRREKPHSAVIKSNLDPHPPLIRTKAVRCTKVNILPPMHPPPTNTDNSITRATMSWDAMASIPQDNDQDCSAFLLDFDISDLLLPDMPPQYFGDHSMPPPRSHSPHWTTTTHVFFQPNLTHQMNGSSCA